jgi:hypothetical protein
LVSANTAKRVRIIIITVSYEREHVGRRWVRLRLSWSLLAIDSMYATLIERDAIESVINYDGTDRESASEVGDSWLGT